MLIAASLKIKIQDILSNGDNYTDITMFEISGYSVTMGNSDLKVKRSADEVALSNNQTGVRDYLIRKF